MAKPWRTRRFFRVLYESPLILRVNRVHRKSVRLTQRNLSGKMLDLSEGGCGIETAYFIPKGTRMNIFLDRQLLRLKDDPPPPKGHSRIVAMAISCAVKGLRKYRVGMQFVRVSKDDQNLISKFIKFHERRKDPRVQF